MTKREFLQCDNDEIRSRVKVGVLYHHRSYYVAIEDDIRKWLNEYLPIWLAAEPLWFNDQVKSAIPDHLVNDPNILKQIRGKEVKKIMLKRRNSLKSIGNV
jgi:hypothetical protein